MESKESKFKNILHKTNISRNIPERNKKTLKLSLSTINLCSKFKSSRYIKNKDNLKNLTNSRTNLNKKTNIIFNRKIQKPSLKPLKIESNYQKSQLFNITNQGDSRKPLHTVSSSSYIRRNENKNKNRNNKTQKTNNNSFFVNNLNYYIKCPHCHHVLNEEPKKGKIINQIYNKFQKDDKENLDENILKIIREHTYNTNSNKNTTKIIYEDYDMKNYDFNERGGVVFKSKDGPTNNILIVHHRQYSTYLNESKVLGKKQNIGIYEAPPPQKIVFVRPINI